MFHINYEYMWNLTIIDDDINSSKLNFLYDNIADEIVRIGGMIELSSEKHAVFVRVREEMLAYGKALIRQILAETIVEKYKPIFFEEALELSTKYDLNGLALLKTICVLDKVDDINEIKADITLTDGEFHIDSFWLFHLDSLKNRWREVSDVVMLNMADIVTTDAFLDIVRYLLKMVQKNVELLKVVETDDEILFYNHGYEKLTDISISKNDVHKDEKVISTIIDLSPKIVQWESSADSKLKDLALAIFG